MSVDTSYAVPDGSAAAPSFAFLNAPGTGFFRDPVTGAIVSSGSGVRSAALTPAPLQVTGASLAALANGASVVVTTEALATAAGSVFTYVLTNSLITANSNVMVTVSYGTATAGVLVVQKVAPGAGTVSI